MFGYFKLFLLSRTVVLRQKFLNFTLRILNFMMKTLKFLKLSALPKIFGGWAGILEKPYGFLHGGRYGAKWSKTALRNFRTAPFRIIYAIELILAVCTSIIEGGLIRTRFAGSSLSRI